MYNTVINYGKWYAANFNILYHIINEW